MSIRALIGVGNPVYQESSEMLNRASLRMAPKAKKSEPIIIIISKKVPVLNAWNAKIAGAIPNVNESLKESNSFPILLTVFVLRAI